jgi:hypothetical protein
LREVNGKCDWVCSSGRTFWWVFGSIAVSFAAEEKGRSIGAWLFLGFLISPILAAILLLTYRAKQAEATVRVEKAEAKVIPILLGRVHTNDIYLG